MSARIVDIFDSIGIFVESYEVDLGASVPAATDRAFEREALRMSVEYGVAPTQQLSNLKAHVRPSPIG